MVGRGLGLSGALSVTYSFGARRFIFERIRSRVITDITTSQSLVRGGKVLPVAQIVRSFYYFNVRNAAGVRMSEITTLRTTSEKKSVPHYQISMYPHSFLSGVRYYCFHTTAPLPAICERRRRENQWVGGAVTYTSRSRLSPPPGSFGRNIHTRRTAGAPPRFKKKII